MFDRTTERAADLNALIAQANAIARATRTTERAPRHAPARRGALCMGVLLLDKPLGLTSNDALQKAQAAAARRKGGPHRHARPAGHRRCCRCASARPPSSRRRSLDADKAYRRHAAAGRDARAPATPRARCVERARRWPSTPRSMAALRAASPARSQQVPPMHSALKHERQRAVRLRARRRRGRSVRARDRSRFTRWRCSQLDRATHLS
jgi:tRNA U55 pseudouridine synthase TruB